MYNNKPARWAVLSRRNKKIYKMRWGIENSFRELKYATGVSCLHSKKEEYIIQEILARVILYNFCEIIITNVTITQEKGNIHTRLIIQWLFSCAGNS